MGLALVSKGSTSVCGSALAMALLAGSAFAADRITDIDIPAQPMAAALRELAWQTGANVLYLPAPGPTLISRPVRLRDTAEGAARALVSGTSLEVIRDRAGALIVRQGAAVLAQARRPAAAPLAGQRPIPRAEAERPEVEAAAPSLLLDEVIVTATRQPETVNRVPLSVTAQTQRALDQQGIHLAADLQGAVPALSVSQSRGAGIANIAIRGITDSAVGASTTGFYLDDTPLTKRNTFGSPQASGNGSPVPPLFDLERIEVLRGPQGTLYGGSSEGGTIRYITPQPSLTRYSTYARAELSGVEHGGTNWEAGVAAGGPLVQDRLGFRASVYKRHDAGWLDDINPFTGLTTYRDVNAGEETVLRLALLWAPTRRLRATLSFLSSNVSSRSTLTSASASAAVNLSTTAPIVVPAQCFDTSGVTPARYSNFPPPVPCGSPGVTYVRPGFTYPRLTLGPDAVVQRGPAAELSPSSTNLTLPSLTLDYDFGPVLLKSVTSYVFDKTRTTVTDGLSQVGGAVTYNFTYGGVTALRGIGLASNFQDLARANGRFYSLNQRVGSSQELRVSSPAASRPLDWVAGVFYANMRNHTRYDNVYQDLDLLSQRLFGISAAQRYGVPGYDVGGGVRNGFDHNEQRQKDVEFAGFGEVNYWITSRLKLTGGLRLSRIAFSYDQVNYGPAEGTNTPTPGRGLSSGTRTESPITPKLGAQYQITDTDMVYVVAAKGFRSGGVNPSIAGVLCNTGLALNGLSVDDLPKEYAADTVWSYEGGAKLRLFGSSLQLNSAVYRIDWRNVQLAVAAGNSCTLQFIANAGAGRSQGLELEAEARPAKGLTLSAAFGYTDAQYTANAIGVQAPAGFPSLIAAYKGQKIAVPPVTLAVGARYDRRVAAFDLYVRADYRYAAGSPGINTATYGLTVYAPDNTYEHSDFVNLRFGVEVNGVDVNVFANNAFSSRNGPLTGGRTQCAAASAGGTAACTSYLSYNPYFTRTVPTPRTLGVQIAYRH